MLRATLFARTKKQPFPLYVYSDVRAIFESLRRCIYEVKALFYHLRLFEYLGMCTAAQAAAQILVDIPI